jgi:membrane protein YqaA with SNARE-associated domain
MAIPDWLKHVIGGGAVIGATSYLMDKYVKSKKGMDEHRKKMLFSVATGAVSGGAAGYFLGERVIDGKMSDGKKKKIVGTMIGTAGGALIGYYIGKGAVKSYDAKKEPAKERIEAKDEEKQKDTGGV